MLMRVTLASFIRYSTADTLMMLCCVLAQCANCVVMLSPDSKQPMSTSVCEVKLSTLPQCCLYSVYSSLLLLVA
jgi:hypothetical protein